MASFIAMIEATLFHPVAQSDDLGSRPLAVVLMGERVVLWRDPPLAPCTPVPTGARTAAPRCRWGQVVGDSIECPYHGWRFDTRGQCVAVPALPAFVPPPEHRACMYSARVAYGLVWVALRAGVAADEPGPLPAFAAEDDERLRKINCGPYDVATSGPRLIENFLDMSHFGFVHEGWLGSRDRVAMEPHPIAITPTGFVATGCMAWQPQSSLHATSGSMVEYTYEVNAPYTCVLTKTPEAATVKLAGFRESIAMFVCPVSPEQSRVWIRLAMNDFESSDATLQAFQHTIFTQDQPVLESQRPRTLPISESAPVKELHSAADRSSAAYRRYLRAEGITYGVC